jgi:hypothetical protein
MLWCRVVVSRKSNADRFLRWMLNPRLCLHTCFASHHTCTHSRTQPLNFRTHSSNADFRAGEVHRIIGAGRDGELASLAGDQLHQLSTHSEKPASSVHECGVRCVECLLLYSHGLVMNKFSSCSSFLPHLPVRRIIMHTCTFGSHFSKPFCAT